MLTLPANADPELATALAEALASTRRLLTSTRAEFSAGLAASAGSIGVVVGLSSVAVYASRRARGRQAVRWREVAKWCVAGEAAPAALLDERWRTDDRLQRSDTASVGPLGRRRPATLLTRVAVLEDRTAICVSVIVGNRRAAAVVFGRQAGEPPPAERELTVLVEAARVLGGALVEYARVQRLARRRRQQAELVATRERSRGLEAALAEAVAARDAALARQASVTFGERTAELARANAALTRSASRLVDLDHLDAFFESVVEELADAVGAVTGCIFLYDPATDLLTAHLLISRGRRIDLANDPAAAPFREPIAATGHYLWAALRRHEVHWWDCAAPALQRASRFGNWDRAQRHRFAAAVPMLDGDDPVGFLGLAFADDAPSPSPLRVELCRSLAQHAALAARLARLAEQVREAAVLGERARLARDLHDTIAQGLTGILLQLQAADEAVGQSARVAHVRRALAITRESLVDARRAVFALRAPRAEPADLGSVLDSALKPLFAGTGTRVLVEITGERRALPDGVDDDLLRIAQEAAVNALKHAAATSFSARLHYDESAVTLRIEDDGRGFDARLPCEGFGLRGMRERVERLRGELSLASSVGLGTRIAVKVATPSE